MTFAFNAVLPFSISHPYVLSGVYSLFIIIICPSSSRLSLNHYILAPFSSDFLLNTLLFVARPFGQTSAVVDACAPGLKYQFNESPPSTKRNTSLRRAWWLWPLSQTADRRRVDYSETPKWKSVQIRLSPEWHIWCAALLARTPIDVSGRALRNFCFSHSENRIPNRNDRQIEKRNRHKTNLNYIVRVHKPT